MKRSVDIGSDEYWMGRAIEQARKAEETGEVPIGAVLVAGDIVLGTGFNRVIADSDPTAHAEIVALRAAARECGNYRLPGTTLYVTLEPCAMCAGALVQARVERLVFGAADPRAGAAGSVFQVLDDPRLNHRLTIVPGVLAGQARELLQAFFRSRRGPEDTGRGS